jgi:hypothetical protein
MKEVLSAGELARTASDVNPTLSTPSPPFPVPCWPSVATWWWYKGGGVLVPVSLSVALACSARSLPDDDGDDGPAAFDNIAYFPVLSAGLAGPHSGAGLDNCFSSYTCNSQFHAARNIYFTFLSCGFNCMYAAYSRNVNTWFYLRSHNTSWQ